MNDTQIVDEILRLLHKENAGHFDRVNLMGVVEKAICQRRELVVDSIALDLMRYKGLDDEIQRTIESVEKNVGEFI